ncbi:uncharacterized protein LOC108907691 isoform X2 [Anoplophora glabripennis]|nr:uncharacterized protein LOC108907691 isoform X2 [Anoplophora glabripennis]XP_018566990.1 uncharacterized protein LOC108907691 isoform X2 [Anoplophora glabripennis]XP_018566992.1 uncharacterized protein LOC108907691 isoform X2 [Anoplophora glabripennis]
MRIRKRDVRKRTKKARGVKLAWKRRRAVAELLNEIVDTVADEADGRITVRAPPVAALYITSSQSSQASTSSEIFCPRTPPNIKSEDDNDIYNFLDTNLLEDIKGIDPLAINDKKLLGCRIVNIDYFLKKSMSLQMLHNQNCSGGSLEIAGEKRQGLKSTFILKCNVCDEEVEICNEEPTLDNESTLNKAAAWATACTGSTYKHMTEFFNVLDIPCLSRNSFVAIQKELEQAWQNCLWRNLEEAGEEEYSAAIERGHVDSDGVPYITVYVDGGWSKRSYGHTCNAFSAVAVIIGKHTGKLLLVGVRDKYCSICARAEYKNYEPKYHICFKNWASSLFSAEQDVLVEGFNCSLKMHNLRYKKFVADGDSSMYTTIKENVSYGQQVEKIGSMNYALLNYENSLYKIQKDTEGVPDAARKLLTTEIIDELTKSVQIAIYANYQDVENLKLGIRNTLYHVFGNHMSCPSYLCNNIGNTAEDKTQELTESGLHHHVYGAMTRLLTNTDLLMDKETSNQAEIFMSILVMFDVCKRPNLIQSDSFQMRAYLTGLRYSGGLDWHT